jgi:hypothetical protein
MPRHRRLWIVFACVAATAPLLARDVPQPNVEVFAGKVLPLAEVVEEAGGKLDADAAPALVLSGDDGKIYLLVKDAGSRLFFKDKALLRRPMRLTGRPLPGSQILRVTAVHSVVKGQTCEVYYWCDVCSIRRGEKNICECCGGPMVLREEPLKK